VTLFIQNDATGAGQSGGIDAQQAAFDLGVATNGDTGLGLAAQIGDRQQVTYVRTDPGFPAMRIDTLVNTNFNINPQNVDIVVVPVLANFVLNDGRSILTVGGTALGPQGSGQPGAGSNNTNSVLVIYDTSQNNGAGWCMARAGTNGTQDLPTSNPVILFHELSHAFRLVTNANLALSGICNPSSPEEAAAINDENQLRTQIANVQGVAPVLRDAGIHCGGSCGAGGTGGTGGSCCIVATVTSGSPLSREVAALRAMRDSYLRPTEIGHAFFQQLHHDYYAFSPQVATAAAGDLQLRKRILDGFVRPLITILGVIRCYSLEGGEPAELARSFREGLPKPAGAASGLAGLIEIISDGTEGSHHDSASVSLLVQRALGSAHVMWALWEPVSLYYRALARFNAGDDDDALGEVLASGIAEWAGAMPIDAIWGTLDAKQATEELNLLRRTLLRAPVSSRRFRDRLGQRYGHVTAVAGLLN
jgi:hypothetical protein